eukprot:TRINITY_DN5126_c1_g1_i4.p1 TRINITY_DN5126_c1_g1~~TRINITY_DN5126_c1_g1_i4.p1  ORF type:complete len:1072 (-),score=105.02 TRINITY_DN5126_c1_g1_i4:337-3552(-)
MEEMTEAAVSIKLQVGGVNKNYLQKEQEGNILSKVSYDTGRKTCEQAQNEQESPPLISADCDRPFPSFNSVSQKPTTSTRTVYNKEEKLQVAENQEGQIIISSHKLSDASAQFDVSGVNGFNSCSQGKTSLLLQDVSKNVPRANLFQKPQDPRLQSRFTAISAGCKIQTSKPSLECVDTTNTPTYTLEEQFKGKRRLNFGQSINRREEKLRNNNQKPADISTPSTLKTHSPPAQCRSQELRKQQMQSCQANINQTKANLAQITQDLDLLQTELHSFQTKSQKLQRQIQELDTNIEFLSLCPSDGEVYDVLGEEFESFDDEESLTSVRISGHLEKVATIESGEETEQSQKTSLIPSVPILTSVKQKQLLREAVRQLRRRVIVRSRFDHGQIAQSIIDTNQGHSIKNKQMLNALMPCVAYKPPSTNKKSLSERQLLQFFNSFLHVYQSKKIRVALLYRRQLLKYRRLLRDKNLEDDDDDLDEIRQVPDDPKFRFAKFRMLRSTELAMAAKVIRKGIPLPEQYLTEHAYGKWYQVRTRFVQNRGRIDNPIEELVKDLVASPWTQEQKHQFVKAFMQYPKQYDKIAEYVHGRTSRECVAFYYRNQKSSWFAPIKLKLHQMRRQKRHDMRRAETFMQINRASQQRLINQNKNYILAQNSCPSPKNSPSHVDNNQVDNFTNARSIQAQQQAQNSIANCNQSKEHRRGNIKFPIDLNEVTRGPRSKRKRAKEVVTENFLSLKQLQPPVTKRRRSVPASQARSSPANCSKNSRNHLQIDSNANLTTNFNNNSSLQEMIGKALTNPPLFKNGNSSSTQQSCFFTDLLQFAQAPKQHHKQFPQKEPTNSTDNDNVVNSQHSSLTSLFEEVMNYQCQDRVPYDNSVPAFCPDSWIYGRINCGNSANRNTSPNTHTINNGGNYFQSLCSNNKQQSQLGLPFGLQSPKTGTLPSLQLNPNFEHNFGSSQQQQQQQQQCRTLQQQQSQQQQNQAMFKGMQQNNPRVQQFGGSPVQTGHPQFRIDSLDSIMGAGEGVYKNKLPQFPLEQYLFNQMWNVRSSSVDQETGFDARLGSNGSGGVNNSSL